MTRSESIAVISETFGLDDCSAGIPLDWDRSFYEDISIPRHYNPGAPNPVERMLDEFESVVSFREAMLG